jgi:hypothetical protein
VEGDTSEGDLPTDEVSVTEHGGHRLLWSCVALLLAVSVGFTVAVIAGVQRLNDTNEDLERMRADHVAALDDIANLEEEVEELKPSRADLRETEEFFAELNQRIEDLEAKTCGSGILSECNAFGPSLAARIDSIETCTESLSRVLQGTQRFFYC